MDLQTLFLDGLTTITLGVLIWYTIETFKLRKAAEKQVEQAAMPVLTLIYEGSRSNIRIVNLGTGPAFDARTSALTVGEDEVQFIHQGTIGRDTPYPAAMTRRHFDLSTPDLLELMKRATSEDAYRNRTVYKSAAGKWYQSTYSFGVNRGTQDLKVTLEKHEEIPEPKAWGGLGAKKAARLPPAPTGEPGGSHLFRGGEGAG